MLEELAALLEKRLHTKVVNSRYDTQVKWIKNPFTDNTYIASFFCRDGVVDVMCINNGVLAIEDKDVSKVADQIVELVSDGMRCTIAFPLSYDEEEGRWTLTLPENNTYIDLEKDGHLYAHTHGDVFFSKRKS